MTQPTDQERAELPNLSLVIYWLENGCNVADAISELKIYQNQIEAARRAQVVPNELREAAQAVIDRWDSPLWKDLLATGDYIARLRTALDAAPQQPEAGGHVTFQTQGGTAPVQMPEPAVPYAIFDCHGFYVDMTTKAEAQSFCDHHNKRDADGGGSAPYTAQALYTEHQVRQLLADNGIGKDKA